MQPINKETWIVPDRCKDVSEENGDIEELKESFVLMKSNIGRLKYIGKKSLENSFKWMDVETF